MPRRDAKTVRATVLRKNTGSSPKKKARVLAPGEQPDLSRDLMHGVPLLGSAVEDEVSQRPRNTPTGARPRIARQVVVHHRVHIVNFWVSERLTPRRDEERLRRGVYQHRMPATLGIPALIRKSVRCVEVKHGILPVPFPTDARWEHRLVGKLFFHARAKHIESLNNNSHEILPSLTRSSLFTTNKTQRTTNGGYALCIALVQSPNIPALASDRSPC